MNKLIQLRADKQKVDRQIKDERGRLHRNFIGENRRLIKVIDVLFVVMILMNFGAIFITNLLIVRESSESGKDMHYYELNPVQAEVNDYETVPIEEVRAKIEPYLFNFFMWILLLVMYVYTRRTICSNEQLMILLIYIAYYFVTLGLDFFNDLGFLVGEVMFRR